MYHWEFEKDGQQLSVDVDGPLTLSDIDCMVDAALSGNGLADVFEAAVREPLTQGRLVRGLRLVSALSPPFSLLSRP